MSVLTDLELVSIRHERDRLATLLAAAESGTIDAIASLERDDRGGVFARELATVLGITHAAACMRLERLLHAGFVQREYVSLRDRGGRAWRYSLSRDAVRAVST